MADSKNSLSHLNLEAHLFICTNTREKGESCGAKGSCEMRDRLKKLSKSPELGWKGRVRVNAAGCLGHCDDGIVAVMYPQSKWFINLESDDDEVLLDALRKTLSSK